MAPQVSVTVTLQDKTAAALASIQNRLGGLAKSVSAVKWLEFGKIAVEALRNIGERSGAASQEAGKNFQSLQDVFSGLQASIGNALLGNTEFVNSIKQLVSAFAPLISTLLNALVPILNTVIQSFLKMYGVIRPIAETVLSYAIPAFQRLGIVAKLAANGMALAKAYLTGNSEEVKRLKEESIALGKELVSAIKPINVDLAPLDPNKLEAIGKKSREMMQKGSDKAKKADDPAKTLDAEYGALLKLSEANKLSADQTADLTNRYKIYKLNIDDTSKSLEERTQALDNVAQYDKLATDRIEAQKKALDDLNSAIEENTKKEQDRLNAQVRLVSMGKGKKSDKDALTGQLDLIKSDLATETDPIKRLGLEEQFAAITEALKGQAVEVENTIGLTFSNAIFNGFQTALDGKGITGLFKGFFSELTGSIAGGIQRMTLDFIKGFGKFSATQAKTYGIYGKILSTFAKFLSNPYTAGFAALAIAAGVGALSRSLGAQASSGGGFSGGATFSQQRTDSLSNGLQGDATVVIQGGLLDMSNPEQARSLARALEDLSGRRVTIMRA